MANVEIVTSQVSFTVEYADAPLSAIPGSFTGTTTSVVVNKTSNIATITQAPTVGVTVSDNFIKLNTPLIADTQLSVNSNSNITLISNTITTLPVGVNWNEFSGNIPDFLGNNATINLNSTVGANAYIPIASLGVYDFIYDTPGTYSWTCPADVYLVNVVCIGGGGGGYSTWASSAGSGGGLGWKNNISVTPGQSYTIVVGAGGTGGSSVTAGGTSYFIAANVVSGYGGGNATANLDTNGPNKNSYGGGYVGDGGGAGGNASSYTGGGGAGGYIGTGGNSGANGTGGSGAGGSYYSSTFGVGAGGGVGLYGLGTSGTVSATTGGGGGGGSDGTAGSSGETSTFSATTANGINGGLYGGGGGGPGTTRGGGNGGRGAVRIMCRVGTLKTMTVTAGGYSANVNILS